MSQQLLLAKASDMELNTVKSQGNNKSTKYFFNHEIIIYLSSNVYK